MYIEQYAYTGYLVAILRKTLTTLSGATCIHNSGRMYV